MQRTIDLMEAETGSLFVLDEHSKFLTDKSLTVYLRTSKNYFLIITRDDLAMPPYGVEDVFELQGNINNVKMVPAARGGVPPLR